ncbi:sensor histidine kinase, partial [Chloroflexota bacterium]
QLFTFRPTLLGSLINDLIERYQDHSALPEIHIKVDKDLQIQADSEHLSQAFENIIDNVRKYAPDSPLWISIEDRGEFVEMEFRDNGPGIPQEYLPFLFERFYRVPGHVEIRGTGLGLFICSELIQAHQGSISVDSSVGKGTTFHIKLPVLQNGINAEVLPE